MDRIKMDEATKNIIINKKVDRETYIDDEINFAVEGELMVTITLAEYRMLVEKLAIEKERNFHLFHQLQALTNKDNAGDKNDKDDEDKDGVPF